MPTLEKDNYLIHYNLHINDFEITSVEIFAEAEVGFSKTNVWVWADSLPNELKEFVYEKAVKILEGNL